MTDVRAFDPGDVLAFWRAAGTARWYKRDDGFDAGVRERFFGLWHKALAGELSSWETTDEGPLALVIVLDQFPRNMFRGKPEAYSSDALAREVARRAIARGADARIEPELLEFLYMPFMHSEHLADQRRCVELFRDTGNPKTSDMPRNMPTSSAGSAAFRIETKSSAASQPQKNRPFSTAADFPASTADLKSMHRKR